MPPQEVTSADVAEWEAAKRKSGLAGWFYATKFRTAAGKVLQVARGELVIPETERKVTNV